MAGNQQFVSFFVELNGATVTGLTLDDVTAVVSSAAAGVTNLVEAGGLARNAIDSTIDGNTVRDATVSGPDVGNGYNSGFIARASGSTVSNNMIAGAMRTTGDKYASAFLGYLGADTVVEKNLIAADPGVTYTVRNTAGGDNNSSGVLVDYVGANMDGQTIRGNVVYSGSVYAHATGAFSNLGWVTAVNAEQVEEYGTNLVNARNNRAGFPAVAETAITDEPLRWTRRSGAGYQHDVQTASGPLWRPGDEGTPVSHAELQEQPTYEALGWDFGNGWRWDAEAGHPVLQSAPSLTTQRSSLTIAVGADRSESEILEALGAASDRGALSIDLAGVDFAAEGVYTAEVVAAEGRFRSSAPVEITITSLPFVTVAETSASFRVGSAPTAAEVLEALGAAADRGELAIDLSGVDFAALGSYDAVVTATDGGAVSQPVAVSIAVVPLSGAGTAASPSASIRPRISTPPLRS
ncbi:hypothetical protein [Leucobacter soli]|uniref:hypothetical protein n=1 Tax=Leucobacter soli TaxID=2812850 RepID=UPI00360E898C